MKIAVYSTKPFERRALEDANRTQGHELLFLEEGLTPASAARADGCAAVCLFVSDRADAAVIARLAAGGTRLLALRSAGFDHVDLDAAAAHGVAVARVPAYSPHAVAEHAVALMLALDRHLVRAAERVRAGNFLLDGLIGSGLHGRAAAVVGTGNIGAVVCRILLGFGCTVVAHDPRPDARLQELGVAYLPFADAIGRADVISLHVPLTPDTRHLVDGQAIARMKPGVTLINTSRGAVVDTEALIDGLESGSSRARRWPTSRRRRSPTRPRGRRAGARSTSWRARRPRGRSGPPRRCCPRAPGRAPGRRRRA